MKGWTRLFQASFGLVCAVGACRADAQNPRADWGAVSQACKQGTLDSSYVNLLPNGAAALDPRVLSRKLMPYVVRDEYAEALEVIGIELGRVRLQSSDGKTTKENLEAALARTKARLRSGGNFLINELEPRSSPSSDNVILATDAELNPSIPLGESVALCFASLRIYHVLWLSTLGDQRKDANRIQRPRLNSRILRRLATRR